MDNWEQYVEVVKAQVTSTVGYHEAEDKKSFMVGVVCAINLAKDTIEMYKQNIITAEEYASEVANDITALNRILRKYGNHD